MAAGDGDADSDAERAETYLRLRAEAELRRALSFPRYRQPRQLPYPARRSYFAAMRMMTVPRGSVTYASTSVVSSALGIAATPAPTGLIRRATARVAASPVGHAHRASAALDTVRQRASLTVWRLRRQFSGPYRPPRAQECLDRVTRLAVVLASAGAISEQVQADVVGELQTALAARSLIDQAELLGHDWQPSRAASLTGGSVLAIPVGLSTEYESHRRRVRVHLGALVVGASCARLSVSARLLPSAAGLEPEDDDPLDLHGCTAVDDRGTRYQAAFSGGGANDRWDGTFRFRPSPSAGVRWLDVCLPGAAPVRIEMSSRVPALPTTSVPLPDGAVGRYLDRLTLQALVARRTMDSDSTLEQGLLAAASDLLEAGLIAPGSPALGRLAAAAELLDLGLPPRLSGLAEGKLPDDWLVLLARWDSEDGPVGSVPLAAQLPDLEGMQCLITGITSDRESASVQAHARGWAEPVFHEMVGTEWCYVTARDDGGFLYIAEEFQDEYQEDGADITFLLRPAIRPQARTLTINFTGRTGQVGVTVPLDWQVDW